MGARSSGCCDALACSHLPQGLIHDPVASACIYSQRTEPKIASEAITPKRRSFWFIKVVFVLGFVSLINSLTSGKRAKPGRGGGVLQSDARISRESKELEQQPHTPCVCSQLFMITLTTTRETPTARVNYNALTVQIRDEHSVRRCRPSPS